MRLVGWAPIQSDWCHCEKRKFGPVKRHQWNVDTEERPCEDTARNWTSAHQERRPRKKPNPPTPWSLAVRVQNCENFCCLGYLVCGSPSKLNTVPISRLMRLWRQVKWDRDSNQKRELVYWEMLQWTWISWGNQSHGGLRCNCWSRCHMKNGHAACGLREVSRTLCEDPELFGVTSVSPCV